MPHVKRRLIALTVLFNMMLATGCSSRPEPVPPVILVTIKPCPSPPRPSLAFIDGAQPFDAPCNIEALLERDDVSRSHIMGLEATIQCYEAQIPKNEEAPWK